MIRLAKPQIPEDALQEAMEVLREGMLVQGPRVEAFEEGLSRFLQVPHAIAVSSGTAALHLSMLALDIHQDDEVIVPAFTFPATANAVVMAGARPVLADIRLDDCCISDEAVAKCITPKTKAILPVHPFGLPADLDKLSQLASKHGLLLIEDAACALGATYKGKKVGGFGKTACFSFHPRKAITTGEGGLITTHDDALAEKLRSLRNHGIVKNENEVSFEWAGLNYRMTEFQAVIGKAQLILLEQQLEIRRQQVELYQELLKETHWLSVPQKFPERESVWQSFHLMLNNNVDRDLLIKFLRDAGIESTIGAYALNVQPFFQRTYGYRSADCPAAVHAYRSGLVLPLGAHLSVNEIFYIGETLKNYQP